MSYKERLSRCIKKDIGDAGVDETLDWLEAQGVISGHEARKGVMVSEFYELAATTSHGVEFIYHLVADENGTSPDTLKRCLRSCK